MSLFFYYNMSKKVYIDEYNTTPYKKSISEKLQNKKTILYTLIYIHIYLYTLLLTLYIISLYL